MEERLIDVLGEGGVASGSEGSDAGSGAGQELKSRAECSVRCIEGVAVRPLGAQMPVPASVSMGSERVEDLGAAERHVQTEGAWRSDRRREAGRRSRIVTGFGSERVEDVAVDERRRDAEGARRGVRRRDEGARGRCTGFSGEDLDRSTGGPWQLRKR